MRLEFVLLVIPVVFVLRCAAGIRATRVERSGVDAEAVFLPDARTVPLERRRSPGWRAVVYAATSLVSFVAAVLGASGMIVGFATLLERESPEIDALAAGGFLAFAGSASVLGCLISQWRRALIVPDRLRALGRASEASVFASPVTPSLGTFLGRDRVRGRREVYVTVGDDLGLWLIATEGLEEVSRTPVDRIAAVRAFGLPRTAGVDEAVVHVRGSDDRPAKLHFRPFTRALDQARAFDRFMTAVRSALSASD